MRFCLLSLALLSCSAVAVNDDYLSISLGGATFESQDDSAIDERGTATSVYAQKAIAENLIYSGLYDGNFLEGKNDDYKVQEHMFRMGLDYDLAGSKEYRFTLGGKVGYWYAEYKDDFDKDNDGRFIYGPSVSFSDRFDNVTINAGYGYYLGFDNSEGMHEAKASLVYHVNHYFGLGLEYRYQDLFDSDRHAYYGQARFFF